MKMMNCGEGSPCHQRQSSSPGAATRLQQGTLALEADNAPSLSIASSTSPTASTSSSVSSVLRTTSAVTTPSYQGSLASLPSSPAVHEQRRPSSASSRLARIKRLLLGCTGTRPPSEPVPEPVQGRVFGRELTRAELDPVNRVPSVVHQLCSFIECFISPEDDDDAGCVSLSSFARDDEDFTRQQLASLRGEFESRGDVDLAAARVTPQLATTLLKQYLEELPRPVVPAHLVHQIVAYRSEERRNRSRGPNKWIVKTKKLLGTQLPVAHYSLLLYLIQFFARKYHCCYHNYHNSKHSNYNNNNNNNNNNNDNDNSNTATTNNNSNSSMIMTRSFCIIFGSTVLPHPLASESAKLLHDLMINVDQIFGSAFVCSQKRSPKRRTLGPIVLDSLLTKKESVSALSTSSSSPSISSSTKRKGRRNLSTSFVKKLTKLDDEGLAARKTKRKNLSSDEGAVRIIEEICQEMMSPLPGGPGSNAKKIADLPPSEQPDPIKNSSGSSESGYSWMMLTGMSTCDAVVASEKFDCRAERLRDHERFSKNVVVVGSPESGNYRPRRRRFVRRHDLGPSHRHCEESADAEDREGITATGPVAEAFVPQSVDSGFTGMGLVALGVGSRSPSPARVGEQFDLAPIDASRFQYGRHVVRDWRCQQVQSMKDKRRASGCAERSVLEPGFCEGGLSDQSWLALAAESRRFERRSTLLPGGPRRYRYQDRQQQRSNNRQHQASMGRHRRRAQAQRHQHRHQGQGELQQEPRRKKLRRLIEMEPEPLGYYYRPGAQIGGLDGMSERDAKRLNLELRKVHEEYLWGERLNAMRASVRQIEQRSAHQPAERLELLSYDELLEEKLEVQRALVELEREYGGAVSKQDRLIVRPLYDKYRNLKRLLVRAGVAKCKESLSELGTILEHEAMEFGGGGGGGGEQAETSSRGPDCEHRRASEPDMSHRGILDCIAGAERDGQCQTDSDSQQSNSEGSSSSRNRRTLLLVEGLHVLSRDELREQLEMARTERRRLRRALKELEVQFEARVGRRMRLEDRDGARLTDVYDSYKQAKAKFKLIRALVAKDTPS